MPGNCIEGASLKTKKMTLMKRYGYSIFFFATVLSHTFAQSVARVESLQIYSEALNQEREFLVYTPVGYDERVHEYFNVVYVFDSQNREFFDFVSSIIPFLTDADPDRAYLVVGITSPYNEALDYSRNNDLLPVLQTETSLARYAPYYGNAPNFLRYVSMELMPHIEANYRTRGGNMAVGHSLSASFILYSLLQSPNLFQSYIAVSPNFAYDQQWLANELITYDYSKIQQGTYLYLSHADEGIDYWKEWKPAREKVYDFFRETESRDRFSVTIASYPDKNHLSTFPTSAESALSEYFENYYEAQEGVLSEEGYEVSIRVKVPDKNDTIYLTGNQENLGNWNPAALKMEKITDFEREITLTLKSLAQFKFTRGSWESQAEVKGSFGTVKVKPERQRGLLFEIESYYDRY